MRHFLAQFGPTLQLPWTKLTDVPELTGELLDKLVAQSDAQAGGRSTRELERLRDDCLVSVMQGLRTHDMAAGASLAAHERALHARAPAPAAADDDAPLRLHTAVVAPEWIDYNGHAHESRYLQVFGDTTDALLRHLGLALDGGDVYFTVETHLSHLGQARADERLHTTTQVLGHDEKRLHVFHALHRTSDGALLATAEQMLLHVEAASGRAAPAPAPVLERVARIAAAHAALPRPERAGRAIGSQVHSSRFAGVIRAAGGHVAGMRMEPEAIEAQLAKIEEHVAQCRAAVATALEGDATAMEALGEEIDGMAEAVAELRAAGTAGGSARSSRAGRR